MLNDLVLFREIEEGLVRNERIIGAHFSFYSNYKLKIRIKLPFFVLNFHTYLSSIFYIHALSIIFEDMSIFDNVGTFYAHFHSKR